MCNVLVPPVPRVFCFPASISCLRSLAACMVTNLPEKNIDIDNDNDKGNDKNNETAKNIDYSLRNKQICCNIKLLLSWPLLYMYIFKHFSALK